MKKTLRSTKKFVSNHRVEIAIAASVTATYVLMDRRYMHFATVTYRFLSENELLQTFDETIKTYV